MLGAQKINAIYYLLSTSTIADAAECAGCSERSIYNWVKEEDFIEAYNEIKSEQIRSIHDEIKSGLPKVADVIVDLLLNCDSPRVKLGSADVMFEFLHERIKRENILHRIRNLEKLD